MYVFSFGFWFAILPVALVHSSIGARAQRGVLVAASIAVYASFDVRLLPALAFVVMATWAGIRVHRLTDDPAMLRFSRVVAAGVAFLPLVGLRYADSVLGVLSATAGVLTPVDGRWTIELLLPIGVAFYTLQAVDAMFAVHRGARAPTFIEHTLFVSFFPTVFIGPVQQFNDLMPQLKRRRRITGADLDQAAVLILFGLFQKLVIADNLLPIADRVFESPGATSGPEVIVGAVAFGIGVIANLAAYMAVITGLARLFGIRLGPNLRHPYLAVSPIDFWDRWHISVTRWFLRFVFVPLRGAMPTRGRSLMALSTTFLLGSVWYGDRPTLLIWGGVHLGAVLAQLVLLRSRDGRPAATPIPLRMVCTFGFVSYSWIWFRADSLSDAVQLHRSLLTPTVSEFAVGSAFTLVVFTALLVASDAAFLRMTHVLSRDTPTPQWTASSVRGTVLATLVVAIFVFSTADLHESVLGHL